METTTLHLHKQNFKFSSAHFLIFDQNSAEKLHGHNYQVKVNIGVPSGNAHMLEKGYFVDFTIFKTVIKAKLDQWDEMVLLPQLHEDMKFTEKGASMEVRFRDRFYVFPKNEVVLLPVTNTSVEQLSRLLAVNLKKDLSVYGVLKLQVSVEETKGQSASTTV